MITGIVNDDLEVVIGLTVFGRGLRKRKLHAQIDTGFNDFLLLPQDVVSFLKLQRTELRNYIMLADGSESVSNYYKGEVLWDGEKRPVLVISTDGSTLIGMALMRGYDLHVSVGEGGEVRLTKQETGE